jgi:hypothetical protein
MHARRAIAEVTLVLAVFVSHLPVAYGAPLGYGREADRAESPSAARPSRGPEIVYANGETGFAMIDLQTLIAPSLRPEAAGVSESGAFFGGGAGVRLGFITLGGRVRRADFHVAGLTTIDGELGARVTIDRFEPYFTFGAGYAKLTSSGDGFAGIHDVDIHGFNGRAGVGADYYADKAVTVGVNFTGDLLAMARPGIDLTSSPQSQAEERAHSCDAVSGLAQKEQCLTNVLHQAEGTSFGFAGAVSLVMGLHF